MIRTEVCYDVDTGRIRWTGTREERAVPMPDPDDLIALLKAPKDVWPSSNTHYVSKKVLRERQELTLSWDKTTVDIGGVDECVLSGLPMPCVILVDGIAVDVDDGTFEFSAMDVGQYSIVLDQVEYQRYEWEVFVGE